MTSHYFRDMNDVVPMRSIAFNKALIFKDVKIPVASDENFVIRSISVYLPSCKHRQGEYPWKNRDGHRFVLSSETACLCSSNDRFATKPDCGTFARQQSWSESQVDFHRYKLCMNTKNMGSSWIAKLNVDIVLCYISYMEDSSIEIYSTMVIKCSIYHT